MTLRDVVDISLRNLWRIKLRATLTTAGVVIAIATFVAMLSFAAGNHRYFRTAFREFGLLNQMSVRPLHHNASDTTRAAVLDGAAVEKLAQIPGVRLAYPYASFDVTATVLDTTVTTTARALTLEALRTPLFARVLGGAEFSSESAREAIVTHEFVERIGADPDSLVGRTLVISMRVASLDSALAATIDHPRREVGRLLRTVVLDSIYHSDYQRRFIQRELGARMSRFFEALMNRQVTVADTLTIAAVAPDDPEYRMNTSPVVIPDRTAQRLHEGGFAVTENPADLLAAAREGRLFDPGGAYDSRSFPRVTLELEPLANHSAVKDSAEAMGFRAYSFAEQFAEMQRFMVYYYLGLGVVGLIALATASLGIINTLVMAVSERRREIGILKSLGANEGVIRGLFLMESAVIGAVGSALGVTVGWGATRVVTLVAKEIMKREDMPIFDPFALPVWLVALAISFGVAVSLAAGLYPAARAARVDPVEALRSE
ncbi:MAG: ABC transporter permease [Candidatus Krumholzibacteria bacterium]|nr:ABC transporter permease [Candidatus Krumholzibacteria bacterium]